MSSKEIVSLKDVISCVDKENKGSYVRLLK